MSTNLPPRRLRKPLNAPVEDANAVGSGSVGRIAARQGEKVSGKLITVVDILQSSCARVSPRTVTSIVVMTVIGAILGSPRVSTKVADSNLNQPESVRIKIS